MTAAPTSALDPSRLYSRITPIMIWEGAQKEGVSELWEPVGGTPLVIMDTLKYFNYHAKLIRGSAQ